MAKKKKPHDHPLNFGGPLNLRFMLCHSPYTFLNGLITLGILTKICYGTLP